MSAYDGIKFAIDLSKMPAHYAAAYIIDGDALVELHFDCTANVFEVITSMDLKRVQIVEAKLYQLVCDDALSNFGGVR